MTAYRIIDEVTRETGEVLAEQTDQDVAIGDDRAFVLELRNGGQADE